MDSSQEPSMDEVFLKKLRDIVLQNLSNEDFGIDDLVSEMSLSRSQIHRKLQKIIGKSSTQFIREIKLEEALSLLEGKVATVSEIAYRVGFSSPNYFSKCFQKQYGISPKEVGKKAIKNRRISGQKIKKFSRIWNWKTIAIGSFVCALILLTYTWIIKKDKFKDLRDAQGHISIAVMPFQNMTGDTIWDIWQNGVQNELITNLSNSNELDVRQIQTMYEILQSTKQTNYASITPHIARNISRKLKASTFILGSIKESGDIIRINAQLFDSKTEEILQPFHIDGNSEDDLFIIIDSLSILVKNYLEIEALSQDLENDFHEPFTESSEAFKFYMEGWNYFFAQENESSIQNFSQAVNIDSTFAMAMFYIAWNYARKEDYAMTVEWVKRAYEKIEVLPLMYQNWINLWYAIHVSKNYNDIRKYLSLLENSKMKSRFFWMDLGTTYYYLCYDFEKAAFCFDKIIEISNDWEDPWNFETLYDHGFWYWGHIYHVIGDHKKENELLEIGIQKFPYSFGIRGNQAICALSRGDFDEAAEYINQYISIRNELTHNEISIQIGLAQMYRVAEIYDSSIVHFQIAINIDPENYGTLAHYADMLVLDDVNVKKGMELNQRTLEQYPNSAFRLRTQGYGYYKQGKYAEALKTLKRSDSLFKYWFDIENYQYLQLVEQALANQNQ